MPCCPTTTAEQQDIAMARQGPQFLGGCRSVVGPGASWTTTTPGHGPDQLVQRGESHLRHPFGPSPNRTRGSRGDGRPSRPIGHGLGGHDGQGGLAVLRHGSTEQLPDPEGDDHREGPAANETYDGRASG